MTQVQISMIKKLGISLLIISSLFSVPFLATEVDAQGSQGSAQAPIVLATTDTTSTVSTVKTSSQTKKPITKKKVTKKKTKKKAKKKKRERLITDPPIYTPDNVPHTPR